MSQEKPLSETAVFTRCLLLSGITLTRVGSLIPEVSDDMRSTDRWCVFHNVP